MSSDTVHFWPGGVPADLPVYQGQEQWFHEVEEEIKGWLLFVKVSLPYLSKSLLVKINQENWTTSQAAGTGEGGIEYAPSQRRKLMLQWASYSQSVREVSRTHLSHIWVFLSLRSIVLTIYPTGIS